MTTEEMQRQIESMMPTPKQIVENVDKKLEEKRERKIIMTKAELNAHWALPDETLGDGYTMSHKREREAFIKGWYKAFDLFREWLEKDLFNLYDRYVCSSTCHSKDELIKEFKKAMEE